MNHAPGFLKLVEEVMPRVKEIGAEEVAAALIIPPPFEGEVGERSEPGGGVVPNEKSLVWKDTLPQPPPACGRGIILIDVREDHEFSTGHIAGAMHMGRGIIERDIEEKIPNKKTKLVLYCGGGFRSALAADNLQKMGYTNVYSLEGGWRGWCERGFPRG